MNLEQHHKVIKSFFDTKSGTESISIFDPCSGIELKTTVEPGQTMRENWIDNWGFSIINNNKKTTGKIMPEETKSCLVEQSNNLCLDIYDNGIHVTTKHLMPLIKDVQIKNKRAVVVYFADGTQEKAVVKGDDKFSFEQGITICLLKKMLSEQTEDKRANGNHVYGKLVKYCTKVYERNRKAEKKAAEEKAAEAKRIERKRQKYAEKRKERDERQFIIQKNAYIAALKEVGSTENTAE